MSMEQLAVALEYADKKGIEKIVERNPYLKGKEFSTTAKLSVVEGGSNCALNRGEQETILKVIQLTLQLKTKRRR